MKTAIVVLLILILAGVGGIYWNQLQERHERQRIEAAAELARQTEKAAIQESERRNRESARQAIEAEKEADKKLQQVFGY